MEDQNPVVPALHLDGLTHKAKRYQVAVCLETHHGITGYVTHRTLLEPVRGLAAYLKKQILPFFEQIDRSLMRRTVNPHIGNRCDPLGQGSIEMIQRLKGFSPEKTFAVGDKDCIPADTQLNR